MQERNDARLPFEKSAAGTENRASAQCSPKIVQNHSAGVRSQVASVCKVRRIIRLERENVTAGLAHLLHVSKHKRVLRKILGEPVLSKERKGAGSSRGTRH